MSWELASYGLLALALLGGFAWWERSRPSSRTIALVATLAALATLGRIAFAALPNVKPTTDIVLIAGYTLGGAPGFAVGATSAIASNLFFGEGPWTPWQMLAWGVVGLAGAALARWRIPRLPMALICAAAGFGYGLILNFSTWVTFTGQHTLAGFLLIEGQAFPFDLAHALGNFFFYVAFGPALIRSLRRFRLRLDVVFVVVFVASLLILWLSVALARTTPTVARQLAYLHSAENSDGGFGSAPGQPSSQLYTAWALIGIEATGTSPGTFTRDGHTPVSYIESHLDQLQGPGDVERTILALAPAHAPLHDLVSELRDVPRQVNLTSFAILALAAAHAPLPSPAWLAAQQNAGGGFGYAARGDPSDVDDTAAAVEALVAAHGSRQAIARAIAYIRGAQNRDGGFPEQPGGPSDAQSTAWAVQAEIAAHASPAGLAYLERLTSASGATSYSAGNAQTPVWVTSQALAALARAPLPLP
ncbi:MAG: prenyltransferase/squalene oxidase repeat-containing protein [Solirubrobacteraceae bacterium]|jgi:energy-coupling factor transport system substrate-specific component